MREYHAKSAIRTNQLADRRARGAKTIEVHLFEGELALQSNIEPLVETLALSGLFVRVVHMPQTPACSIEALAQPEICQEIENALFLACRVSALQGQRITVVIHQDLAFIDLQDYGMLKNIASHFKRWLSTYPLLSFAIENGAAMSVEGERYALRGSYFDAPVCLAEYLRETLQSDHIGTVLDTCHALSSIRILSRAGATLSLEDYFSRYASTLKLIHLSNARHYGFGKDHGAAFSTPSEVALLDTLLSLMEQYVPHVSATIETKEVNPLGALRYAQVMRLLSSR